MNNEIKVSTSVKLRTSIGAYFSNVFDFYDMTVLSMVLVLISKEFNLTLSEAGLIGTATLIGCGVSAFVWGWIADNKGRKPAMLASIIGFSILTFLIGLAGSYGQILVLRFLSGICIGGVNVLMGTLLNEVWPAHQRGKATTIVTTSSVVGVMLTSLLVATVLPKYGWRMLFLVAILGLVVAFYYAKFVPETEVWKNMRKETQKNKTISLSEGLKLIFSPKLRRNTILACVVGFLAQLSYWGVIFWLPSFLIKERGLTPTGVSGYMAVMSVGSLIAMPLFGVIADKIGRKRTLLIVFVLGALVVPFYTSQHNLKMLLWLIPLLGMSFSYPGLLFTYFPELFPTHVRTLGVGFVYNIGRALSAIGPYTLAIIATAYNLQISMSICGIIYLCGGIVILFMPETLNKNKNTNDTVAEA